MVRLMGEEDLVPKDRRGLPEMCAAGLGIFALSLSFLLDSEMFTERAGLAAFCITLETSLYSLCLFAEEWLYHSKQRYHGQIRRIFQACFRRHVFLGMVLISVLLIMGGVSLFSPKPCSTICLTCAVYLLAKSFLRPVPVEISEICEAGKMNVAHGLAWSFYTGYLKFVLPDLENKIKNYQKPISPRLHILLPLNAAAPNKPEDEDTHVTFDDNLPGLELNRAGVRKRTYKNSVYKIQGQNNEMYHCILEYATPLQTLYQMSQDRSAGFGERERKEQVLLFYKTLSQILENSLECRNRYRLILIDDEHADEPHYLSREIIHHLKQQEAEIHMNPVQQQLHDNMIRPLQEEGITRDFNGAYQEDQMSSLPSLMFSIPGSLRAGPVETTDDFARR